VAGFVVRQATARRPLMPLHILRSRGVAVANVVQILTMAAMFAFQVLITLYLQQVLGYDATGAGLAMLPAAVLIGAVSLGVSARLNTRFGERAVLTAGLVLLVAMFALLVRVPVDGRYLTDVLPVMLLAGGGGLVLPALTSLGMSAARPDDAGLASGLFNTTQQIGMAFGVAVLSTLAAARTAGRVALGDDRATALTSGFHLAFAIGAGLLVVAVALAYALPRPRTAERADAPALVG
ncbi:MFS transporter, partial [Micromonospora sp. NPDC005313]